MRFPSPDTQVRKRRFQTTDVMTTGSAPFGTLRTERADGVREQAIEIGRELAIRATWMSGAAGEAGASITSRSEGPP